MNDNTLEDMTKALELNIISDITYMYSIFVPNNSEKDLLQAMKNGILPRDKEFIDLTQGEHQIQLAAKSFISPYAIIMAKVKDRVTEFYSEIRLSNEVEQQLKKYGNRANIYKQQFQKDIDTSMNNTMKAVTKEIDLAILQKKDVRSVIQTIRKGIASRTEALQKFLNSSYGQMAKYMILWEYQDMGYNSYKFLTVGENCAFCSGMDGGIFSISDALIGENFAPLHPNCNCLAGILDENGNIVSVISNGIEAEGDKKPNIKILEELPAARYSGYVYDPKNWENELNGNIKTRVDKLSSNLSEEARIRLTVAIILEEAKKLQEKYQTVYTASENIVATIFSPGLHEKMKPLFTEYTTDSEKSSGLINAAIEGFTTGFSAGLWTEAFKGITPKGAGKTYSGKPYGGTRNPDVDFINGKGKSTLKTHFDDHKGDFGYTTETEYLNGTRNFLEKSPTSTTQSFVTKDGTYFRYDTATNEFGIMNKYGGSSTYFKPEKGMDYWFEQIELYAPKD